jgi:hypothetical protein
MAGGAFPDVRYRGGFVAFVEEHNGDGQLVARVPFFGESAEEADEQAQMYILGNRAQPELQSAILPGGSLGDFPSLAAQIPGLATAGAQIAAQLHAEGQAQGQSATDIQDRIGTAQNALAQTYSDITTSSSAFQLPIDGPGGALDVAQKYVTSAYTIVGAVDAVGGLAAAAASGNPAAIEQAGSVIVGTIVGLAAAAGAISAGVGAVIVAGAGLVIEGLTALFSHAPPAATVCGNDLSAVPSIVVGCAFSISATRRAPKSVNWRPFPEPKIDPIWYAAPASAGVGGYYTSSSWRGDDWSGGFSHNPDRVIDRAFPDFRTLEAENAGNGHNPIDLFRAAFFVAWKANKAFALNGLTPQDDWQVLSYVTRTWNNAHHGSGSGANSLLLPGNGHGTGADFESGLVEQILNLSPGDPNLVGSRLKINLGPIKTPPRAAALAPASSSTSTAGKVAAVAGLAAVAGVGGWIALGGSPAAAWRAARRFLGF